VKGKLIWISGLAIIVLIGGGVFLIGGSASGLSSAQGQPTPVPTVTIRPASQVAQVSAAGNVDLAVQQPVVFQVQGTVASVPVNVSNNVKVGDTLASLDTTDLQQAVQQAQLSVDESQAQLDKVVAPALQADVTAAQADLASAQAAYQNLIAGQTQDQLTQLSANLVKAQIALQQAQGAYDQIAWRNDVGLTQEAANLQSATIDFESAKAAYDAAIAPPTAAQIASAKAAIVDAQDKLDQLLAGPNQADQRAAEITVQQSQLSLETAQASLAQAVLRAPISGTVLAVNVQAGQMVSPGTEAVTLGDLSTLELVVDVAEVDVSQVALGQPAQISIDALPTKTFDGVVERIDPASTSVSGVVNYLVTIRFTSSDLSQVRPGMTAVATIVNKQESQGWLVPQNALHQGANGSYVQVVQNGKQTQVNVTTGPTQGEWIVVYSPDLHAGDVVVGSVTAPLTQPGATPQPGGFNQFRNLSPGAGGGRGPGD
jgi:RND family efflux transporter MFP subunit